MADDGAGAIRKHLRTARRWWCDGVDWAERRIPPGIRSLVGIGLIFAGTLGFLPVLGFWMLPLGVAVLWVDIRQAYRAIRNRTRDD